MQNHELPKYRTMQKYMKSELPGALRAWGGSYVTFGDKGLTRKKAHPVRKDLRAAFLFILLVVRWMFNDERCGGAILGSMVVASDWEDVDACFF
jgi:hypothetical protein